MVAPCWITFSYSRKPQTAKTAEDGVSHSFVARVLRCYYVSYAVALLLLLTMCMNRFHT
jgi:hypothetical protein